MEPNYTTDPNAGIAEFYAQKNQGGGGYGGGGYSPDMPQEGNAQDMMAIMQKQSDLAEQSAQNNFQRMRQGSVIQGGMEDDAANRQLEMDRKAMGALMSMKQKLLIEDQNLQLKLAGADDDEMDAIREELMQNDTKLHEISRKELEANFQVAGTRKDLQAKLSNSYEHIRQLKDSKEVLLKPVLDVLKSKNAEGRNQNVSDVIDGMMKQPRGLKSQNNWMEGKPIESLTGIKALMHGVEYAGEIFSGNRTADLDIHEAFGMDSGTMPGIMDAALAYNNGSLQPMMSEFINGKGNPAYASEFSANLLTKLIVGGASNAAIPNMDRAQSEQAVSTLVNALIDWKGNAGNKDPKELQKRILPLLKQTSMAMFGTEDNDAEVSEIMDEALAQASSEVPIHARGILTEGSTVLDPDGIRNAALAYGLGQAGRIRSLLGAATSGQLSTSKELSRVISSLDKSKRSKQIVDEFGNVTEENTYEAGAIERLLQDGGASSKILGDLQPDLTKQKGAEEELVKLLNNYKSQKLDITQKGHQLDYKKLPDAQKRSRKQKQSLLDEMQSKAEEGTKSRGWNS